MSLRVLALLLFLGAACRPRTPSPDELRATLVAHPDILFAVIKAHPAEFFQVVQAAAAQYQSTATAAARRDSIRLADDLAHPKQPVLGPGRATMGPADAPIVITEYTDFECPYCRRSIPVIHELFSKYDGRIRLVLKQTPLEIHPQAMAAARTFEAVLRQDQQKAWQLFDLLFDNQARLEKEGQAYLDEAVRQVGADLGRVHQDARSGEIQAIIDADLAEFKAFEFTGTPGFVINGVRVEGSYPVEAMSALIEQTLNRK